MNTFRSSFLVLATLVFSVFPAKAEESTQRSEAVFREFADRIEPAVESAWSWLEVIDDRDYSQSWKETAVFFQSKVPQATWVQQLKKLRGPLGDVTERVLVSASFSRKLPGAPKGEYVVLQFETRFATSSVVETVTPMKEESGAWKVSGYFIK